MSDITSINLLSDDSDDNETAAPAPEAVQKPRNIAVKKGAPVPQPQQQQPPQQNIQIQIQKKATRSGKGILESSQFLGDFNPENSRREKNKRYNLVKTPKPPKPRGQQSSMYDETGKLRYSKQDICDCFDVDCPGCHFDCELCLSPKCGLRCRVNRRWAFEVIEHDGKDMIKTNPTLTTISLNSYRN